MLNNYDLSVIRHRKEELKARLKLSNDDWIVPLALEVLYDVEVLLDHIDNLSVK